MPVRIRHFIPLLLLALCAVAILWLNESIARQQQVAIRTLNLADRQRFLSQRVAGLALELATHANVPRPAVSDDAPIGQQDKDQVEADVRDQLRQSVALMQTSHLALVSGTGEAGPLLAKDAAIAKIYFDNPYDLDHAMVAYLGAANAVADTPSADLNDQSRPLAVLENAAREPLLTALNAAVSAYEAESGRTIRQRHVSIAVLTAAILVLIGLQLATRRNIKDAE